MVRRKTEHSTDALFALCDYQVANFYLAGGHVYLQRGKVVTENKGVFIIGVSITASPFVSRTQVTRRVVMWREVCIRLFLLPLPRPFCSVRRNDYPLARQRIKSSMRILTKIEHYISNISSCLLLWLQDG